MGATRISSVFTDGQLAQIMIWREAGWTYEEIAEGYGKKYRQETTTRSIRNAVDRYAHLFEAGQVVGDIQVLRAVARTRMNASQTAKENRTILAALNEQEDILTQVKGMIQTLPRYIDKLPKPVTVKGKPSMTVEAMLSDLHFGKKTQHFNIEIARNRLRTYTNVLLAEIERKSQTYNVDHVIIGMLGDMIENAVMHGKESTASCEFGNPEQIRFMIQLLYAEVIVPVAKTGIKITAIAITGNHDREEERPTFNNPGKNSLTWIGYQAIKSLADQAGLTNITWNIPEGVYTTLCIYGTHILYEHGDRIKGDNGKKSFLSHIAKRSAQLGLVIKGLRIGHWHEYSCLDNGKVIINASLCGQDSYADVNGYSSIPGQTINYYVQTKNRDNSYYHSLLVQL